MDNMSSSKFGLRRRRISFFLLAILFDLATSGRPASAQVQALVRRANLAFLASRAAIIIEGRVAAVRYGGLPNYPNIRTMVVTLEVERMLRGPEGARYTFRQYVGPQGPPPLKSGYAVGQHLFLFLTSPSTYGLSSPLGFAQGHFRIERGTLGQEMIANQWGNSGLFRNVPEAARHAGLPLDEGQLRLAAKPRGALPLRDFVTLVEHLMRLPRME